MKNFFDKFGEAQKLNLFIGDFVSEITGFPKRSELADMIIFDIKQSAKGYIKNRDSFSDVAQAYLDAVISSKNSLLKQIREIFDMKHYKSVDIYDNIFELDYFKTIMTMNYDIVLEKLYPNYINTITPGRNNFSEEEKINFYKIMGDICNPEDLFITSQDVRKLKVLNFYDGFFEQICTELKSRPTLFLGVELKDPDFIDMLDFIMKKAGKIEQPMYIVSSTSVIDNKVSEVINKYNLKLTVFDEVEFLDGVKNLLQKEDSDKLEKKLVR